MPGNQQGKRQVKAGAQSCKQPGTPDAVRLSRTTPWRPGPSPGPPRMPRKPSSHAHAFLDSQDDLQQEGQSPTQRSHEPGNHGAGVHSGLSGSRSPLPTAPQGSGLKPKSWRISKGTSESIPAHPWPAADAKMLLQGRPGSQGGFLPAPSLWAGRFQQGGTGWEET